MPSDNMKIIIGLFAVGVLLYLINSNYNRPIKNTGTVTMDEPAEMDQPMKPTAPRSSTKNRNNIDPNYPAEIYGDSYDHLDVMSPLPTVKAKSLTPQQRLAKNSIEESDAEWETMFGNRITDNLQIRSTNGNYKPLDETNGEYAMYDQPMKKYKPSKRRDPNNDDGSFDPDMYDPDNLLPQENDLNYFEVVDSQVSLKGRLLRPENPLGINTVGQSKRFASHDLRPVPLCPKFGVSPWNNSSAEPDVNIKTLY
jgi:hypothetical protein